MLLFRSFAPEPELCMWSCCWLFQGLTSLLYSAPSTAASSAGGSLLHSSSRVILIPRCSSTTYVESVIAWPLVWGHFTSGVPTRSYCCQNKAPGIRGTCKICHVISVGKYTIHIVQLCCHKYIKSKLKHVVQHLIMQSQLILSCWVVFLLLDHNVISHLKALITGLISEVTDSEFAIG